MIFRGEEERVIWLAALQECLILQFPAEDAEDRLDKRFLKTRLIFVLRSEVLLFFPEGRQFGERLVGSGSEVFPFRLVSKPLFEPVVRQKIGIADGAELEWELLGQRN